MGVRCLTEKSSLYLNIIDISREWPSGYVTPSVQATSPTRWDKSRIPDQARSQSYFLLDHWLIRSQPLHVSLLYTSTRLIHVPYTRLPLHGKISEPLVALITFFDSVWPFMAVSLFANSTQLYVGTLVPSRIPARRF